MKSLSVLLVLVAAVGTDKIPDFVVPGQCPAIDEYKLWTHQVPHLHNYAGVWYEFALTPNPYQLLKKCVRNEYVFDGKQFLISSTGISGFGTVLSRVGKLYPNLFGEPHFSIDYENTFGAPYVILDTDYTNYACVYSCISYNLKYYSDFAFVFSRSPVLADKFVKQCEAVFKSIHVDTSRFIQTPQGPFCDYGLKKFL
ncbi:crustacyanin-C1 subunit-like [Cherax quadricarinatus]|uniref:crustacyanin-C1 subunit-like n=1 Tax=Cherax quadricarinatus TaxID=27406 RepID=UPI002378C3C5|nr:crustacyanin-C1 subunit-like [Cherax quadricarinatus]